MHVLSGRADGAQDADLAAALAHLHEEVVRDVDDADEHDRERDADQHQADHEDRGGEARAELILELQLGLVLQPLREGRQLVLVASASR
jgi:hypothetical protein